MGIGAGLRGKTAAFTQAVALRKLGLSYSEIETRVRVSRATLSLWLRDVSLNDTQRGRLAELRLRGARAGVAAVKQARSRRAEAMRRAGLQEARERLARRDVRWLTGVMLYWCEGEKTKAWAPSRRVAFTNMDSASLLLFREWLLQFAGVSRPDLSYDLRIHPNGDVKKARAYWARRLGTDEGAIKIYWKRPNHLAHRKNVRQGYYGTMRLRVRRSTNLLHWIEGCIQGVVEYCGVG